jgi:GAF domain-containing protein
LSIGEDAATDPRFSVRPLTVAGRSMRFYAGAPLVLHGGDRIGVLCVLDCLPRRFTLADARHLRWLAKRTAILMNVQKAVEQVAFGRAG